MSARRTLLPALAALAVLAVPATAGATTYKRIVALTPFSANTLMSLGVTPTAVGQEATSDLYSKRLPKKRLPLSHPNGPNLEDLVRVNPDLVLSASTWNQGNAVMKKLHIKVAVDEPKTVAQVPAMVRAIGALVGKQARAAKRAADQQRSIATAMRRAKTHPRVLLVLGVGRTPYAFLPSSWGGDLVTRAGGDLISKNLSGSDGFARMSNEQVAAKQPDIIIAVPHGNSTDIPSIKRYLADNPAWAGTPAVQHNRLYVADDDWLLQPWDRVATSIREIQTQYLKNT